MLTGAPGVSHAHHGRRGPPSIILWKVPPAPTTWSPPCRDGWNKSFISFELLLFRLKMTLHFTMSPRKFQENSSEASSAVPKGMALQNLNQYSFTRSKPRNTRTILWRGYVFITWNTNCSLYPSWIQGFEDGRFNRKKYRLGEGRGTFRALWWLGLVPIGGAWMDITRPRGPHWDMRLPSQGAAGYNKVFAQNGWSGDIQGASVAVDGRSRW